MFRALISSAFALLLLSACAGGPEDDPALDRIADQVLPADTPVERLARVCMVATVIGEVATDRVAVQDPQDLPAVRGALERFARVLDRLPGLEENDFWFNSDLYDAFRVLARATRSLGERRVLSSLAAGLDVNRILTSIGRGAKASRMIGDIKAGFARLEAGELDGAELWAECRGRLDRNLARLELIERGTIGAPAD